MIKLKNLLESVLRDSYIRTSLQGNADSAINAIKSLIANQPQTVKVEVEKKIIKDKSTLSKAQFGAGTWKYVVDGEPLEVVMINAIKVAAEDQGKGIATKLWQSIIEIADNTGAVLALEIIPIGNKAMGINSLENFYSKFGFKILKGGKIPFMLRVPITT